jgi:hypothetical protein
MPDLKEVRVSHPATSFVTGDTFATPLSRHVSYPKALGNMLKEPPHIQAHLVFADTQSPNKKPKELEFCQRSTKTYRDRK